MSTRTHADSIGAHSTLLLRRLGVTIDADETLRNVTRADLQEVCTAVAILEGGPSTVGQSQGAERILEGHVRTPQADRQLLLTLLRVGNALETSLRSSAEHSEN